MCRGLGLWIIAIMVYEIQIQKNADKHETHTNVAVGACAANKNH
jgi:hypothetical protein